jgi:hypothetical protein
MRRFRADEIPQFVNVLKGDMSIVGPRPERPEFVADLQESVPFWDRRHLIKPGITGWAQIRRGYTTDAHGSMEKLSFDLWYLRHRSLVVDFAICAQTIGVLVRGGPPRRIRRGTAFPRTQPTAPPTSALSGQLHAVSEVGQASSRSDIEQPHSESGDAPAIANGRAQQTEGVEDTSPRISHQSAL